MEVKFSSQCVLLCLLFFPVICGSYKILAIFPYNGRSHHIMFSSLVEELAVSNHDVTVVNYFPVKKIANLRQISIQDESGGVCTVNIREKLERVPSSFFVEFVKAYDMTIDFKKMSDENCERMMSNADIRNIVTSREKYDLVILEQFITDCGLAIAFKLNAPVVGIAAHIMMPWTYSRVGAPLNPAFVPNRVFATGTKLSLWQKIQSAIIKLSMNTYYRNVIQRSNQRIVNQFYPEVPDLEILGNNISIMLVNQFFPLTGSRLHGANIVEVGGMHVKEENDINDKELKGFLDNADARGVVYISFGSVAQQFPSKVLQEIMAFVTNTKHKVIWKVDNITAGVASVASKNVFMSKWLPQTTILCHPKVVAFVTHSGMLSTTEAVHCGVPVIAVPLFGDQFFNAAAASENGLGVVLNIYTLNRKLLDESLQIVLQDSYQTKAKQMSKIWKDRPLSAMDTAVYWIEYAARHQGMVDLRPPTVQLNIFEYFMIDILLVMSIFILVVVYALIKLPHIVYGFYTLIKIYKSKTD